MKVEKVISGGQTGVDRAALEVAEVLGLARGGWCPRGRKAEDGPIPAKFLLTETRSPQYAVRTRWNVRDSDGTLLLVPAEPSGGSALTLAAARARGKPVLVVNLGDAPDAARTRRWLADHAIGTLNVAGPRESEHPGIQARAARFLRKVLERKD